MKRILIIVLLLIAAGAGVYAYADEIDNSNSNNVINQISNNTGSTNNSNTQNNSTQSESSGVDNSNTNDSNSKINNNISSNSNTGNSEAQNNSSSNTSEDNTNGQYIVKEKVYINKFANYNGDSIRLYGSLLPRPIPLGPKATYDFIAGPNAPIYIGYKYLIEHNGVIETWYMINYRISLHGTATGYVESNDFFNNLSDVGNKNTCPDVNMKTGINTGASPGGR